jgi:hypothetical protein
MVASCSHCRSNSIVALKVAERFFCNLASNRRLRWFHARLDRLALRRPWCVALLVHQDSARAQRPPIDRNEFVMAMSLWDSIKQARSARLSRGSITRPVKLTVDESELMPQVAFYMLKQRGLPPNARTLGLEDLRSLFDLVTINRGHGYFPDFPWRRSISREDLEVIAPYIDEWIDAPPPQNLPSEYYDQRPDILKSFRQRMVRQGVWPLSEVSKSE